MIRSALPLTLGLLVCAVPWGCSKEREPAPPPKEPAATKAPPASPSVQPAEQGSGTIIGKIFYKGPHKAAMLSVGKDKDVCGDSKPNPALLVNAQGEVRNAVVQIAGGASAKAPPAKEAELDQVKCEYVPHVLVIPAGSTVTIKNSDGILHNIHTLSKDNPAFNRAQPKYLKEIKETFAKPEIIPVRCDVHGWMSGWIVVTANAHYDVTGADGAFKLAGVPAGKHTLEVWHETLGRQERQVDVAADQTAEAIFEFAAKN